MDVNPAEVGRRLRLALALSIPLVAACGPTRSTQLIIEASAELAAAKTANGPDVAPYEYIAAEEYLHKAREEQSYSEFEVAIRLATKARDCAQVAREKAEAGTRKEIGARDVASSSRAACHAGPPGTGAIDEESSTGAGKAPAPPAAAPAPGAPAAPSRQPVVPKDEPKDPLPEGDE